MIEKKGKQMIGLNKSRWMSGSYVHKTYYFRLYIFNWVFFFFKGSTINKKKLIQIKILIIHMNARLYVI